MDPLLAIHVPPLFRSPFDAILVARARHQAAVPIPTLRQTLLNPVSITDKGRPLTTWQPALFGDLLPSLKVDGVFDAIAVSDYQSGSLNWENLKFVTRIPSLLHLFGAVGKNGRVLNAVVDVTEHYSTKSEPDLPFALS